MTTQQRFALHTERVGEPESEYRVVFLHGLFGRGKNFTSIAGALQPQAQSLLVDLPNHGKSDWTDGFSYAQMADLVATELRAGFAANGPVDVVGHSMGGKVAMVLAIRHPDIVRKLVVLDISPTAAASGRKEFQHLLGALAGLELKDLERRSQADELLADAITVPTVRGFLLQNLRQDNGIFHWEPNLELLRAELETIMDFPADLPGGQERSVLWIGGGRSNYVTDADVPAMKKLFPQVARMTVRDAGHWLHSERPQEIIAALRYFLLR